MGEHIQTDLCIIGAGSGGLSVAAAASQMGARVVLVEKHRMGGDCLNTGCVPSKSLLAAAKAAHHSRQAHQFGVNCSQVNVDFQAVHQYVHGVIAKIAPHDSVERFEGLGVKVVLGAGRFVDSKTIVVNDRQVTAKKYILACGSSPVVPQIQGLNAVPYFTNESIFSLTECPRHLLIIGGGPIGIEMAQAHRRLGAEVTVIQHQQILPRDDPDLVDILREQLEREGIKIVEQAQVVRVTKDQQGMCIETLEKKYTGTHLLVATGRQPNVEGLNLQAAGVIYSQRGIQVDVHLRTSAKHIYAIGDCIGGPYFTHVANYHAGLIVRQVLFKLPSRISYEALPWTTYTDPELAQVGMTEVVARSQGHDIEVLRSSISENDRAQTENTTSGLIKVVLNKRGRVLGASIIASNAGELITPWGLAIAQKLNIKALASLMIPYPTLSEVSKRVAGSYFTPWLFSERTRKLVRFLMRF